ncbi:MAG TPA: tetratricopeptide repeat protein [Thermodesulfobacteriota bacterium]|jgi:tetratricopeptide (TPR) repeat protein|nr:tetratricopeptide repeat protein [Thermodesulfobacteriota bacterium]
MGDGRISRILPEDDLSNNGLGISYYSKDEYEKAIGYYEKALSIGRTKSISQGNIRIENRIYLYRGA